MPIARPLAALAAFLLVGPTAVGQVTITVGPNVNTSVGIGSGYESETAIAIDRVNTNRIVIASNWDAQNLFHSYTTNGGASWTAANISTGVGSNAFCDPWMGADSFGNIYLSYLTFDFETRIARSTNGGQTFTTIATITGIPSGFGTDHPELSVGPGTVAGQQTVWVRDSDFITANSTSVRLHAATSTGLGNTSSFTTQTLPSSGNFGSVAVGPTGQVVTTYMTPSTSDGPATLPVWRDPNGTGAGGFTQVNNSIVTQVGGFRFIPAQPYRSIDTQVDLKYDYTGGPRNGRLYMLYTQAANDTTHDTNIVVRSSTDNGTTWSGEVRINDDATVNSQFFGRLAVDQTTGTLAAVWLDARNAGAGNILVELWGSVSTDGGLTWLPNFKISQGQWDGTADNHDDLQDMGDYISLDFHNGKFVVAWPDASNSTGNNPDGTAGLDIYFASVEVTPVPEPATVGLIAAAGLLGAWGVRRWKTARAPVPGGPAC